MYTCTLPTKSFSRLYTDPTQALRRYYCVVPALEIPEGWSNWLEVNARDSSDKGRVPKAIRATLTDRPDRFAEYNRGLTVVAAGVQWDNKTNRLTLNFNDRNYHGVLDGGHTLKAILDIRGQQESDDPQHQEQPAYCNIEILTGLDEDEIAAVVDARNTSKQVASKSLLNLEGSFADLKAVLGAKSQLISWKENEDGVFDVREVIGILTALDAGSYGSDSHPIIAYSSKEACLKRFKEHKTGYEKLYGIANDALRMWDEIQYWMPRHYNEKTHGKFGGWTGISVVKKPKELPFIGRTTDYDIPTAYIYPVLAAFRAMLVEQDNNWVWGYGVDPMQLISEGIAGDLFISGIRESITTFHNPNRTGKDAQAWNGAYLRARNAFLERAVQNV